MIEFGTGGWRAIIGDGFTKKNVQLLSLAIARKIKAEGVEKNGFVIGYDRRFLSEEATQWAAEVMATEGIPCYIINRQSPTPLVMFCIKERESAYGMAITASHNPAIYNGVKVFSAGGRDADEGVTADIEKHISLLGDIPKFIDYQTAVLEKKISLIDPMNEYIDSILASIDCSAIKERGLKVVLDPMYGVSKTALQTILMTTRCEVDVIHERHDTLFGGRLPAPNEKTLQSLVNYVSENGCDIGIATDGDADRLGVIDDKCEFLHPNKILVLLYYYLIKYKSWKGPAVRNIATTHLLDAIAQSVGEKCYEVPVGFKHISHGMLKTGAIIGGESSGGLTVRGHIQGKDGIYAAALLIEMLAKTKKPLSVLWQEIQEEFGIYEMYELDFKFTQEKKDEIYNKIMIEKRLPTFIEEIERVSYLDGCKVYFKQGGWIIARFSGTEPLLRIFCEMDSMEKAKKTANILKEFLEL